MTRQDQEVEGGEGYQAGRDLIVHKGVSAEQMSEIMLKMASQLSQHFVEGQKVLDQRLDELRTSLLEEFAKPEATSDPSAFNEPDFLYAVQGAHETYGRSGDEKLKEELVRLLAERSAKPHGSRIALVLNESIRVAGSLTREDYAAVSAIFLIKNVRVGAGRVDALFTTFESALASFVPNLPSSETSLEYLEAMRCLSLNPFMGANIWSLLRETYWYHFTQGFAVKKLEEAMGAPMNSISSILTPATANFGGNLRFNVVDVAELRTKLSPLVGNEDVVGRLVELHERSLPEQADVEADFRARVPSIGILAEKWAAISLEKAVLTTLGKALAHSSLVSASQFEAPLEIWVG